MHIRISVDSSNFGRFMQKLVTTDNEEPGDAPKLPIDTGYMGSSK